MTAAALLAAGVAAVPAVAAGPDVPTQAEALVDSVKPVLTATVSSPAGGQVTAKFFAGTYAAGGAWDLVNGGTVTVASGSVARYTIPTSMPLNTEFDWQVQACQGSVCSALTTLADTHVSPMLGAGARSNATRLSFSAGDHVSAQVDVGSGNLLVNTSDLSLPGINGDVGLGAAYNSSSVGSGFTSTAAAAGYGWLLTPYDVSLTVHKEGSVTYRGRAGVTGLFVKNATGFTAPGGFKADLVKNGDGTYTLTDHSSQAKQTFNTSGRLTKTTDRNGNATTLAYNGALPSSIVSTRGTTSQRTAVYSSASGHVTTLQQTGSDGTVRTVTYTVNSSGDLASVKDTLNRTTTFAYSAHQLSSITNPGGGVTSFAYGAKGVTTITQRNTAVGSPGDSITRLTRPSATQTLVASPNTNQAQAVAAVPHTTYDLTADNTARVSTVTDAQGHTRSKTYTANFDTATNTQGSGSGAATTTNSFTANDGESLTGTVSPSGASSSALYENTGASSKYAPSSGTDAQSNKTTFSYNGAGNRESAKDANASEAKVTYNDDGTVATSTDPENTTKTTYGYDTTTHQATTVAPAGGTLGNQAYTYDAFGRLATAKDGRGITTTNTYDLGNRITQVSYSDGTTPVGYGYDAFGRVQTRTDATGTTTYTYDDLGRLATRTSTSGGGTLTYGYDKSGNLLTVHDGRGTARYSYDDANLVTQLLTGNGNKVGFAYDDHARRTDTWYGTDTDHTIFKAHVHQDYDASSRVSRVWADEGPATAPVRQFDTVYCRSVNSPTTCSATKADDRDQLQWSKDNLTGKTTTYSYDTANRLKGVATSGGGKTYTYTYDARGNRKTAGDGTTTQSLSFDAANQITTSGYTFDGKGSLTKTPSLSAITYNGAGQMTAATKSTGTGTYQYAGTNQNELTHQTTDAGEGVDYVYGRTDAHGMPVIEQVKLAAGTAFIDHDPVTGEPLVLRTTTGSEAYYITDGLGSPVEFINQNTDTSTIYKYDPYGAYQTAVGTGSAAAQNPYRFVGGTYDRTTGYIKYGQRWYDPTTGRFTSQDKLSFLANPGKGNRYAYAADDPINNIDPTGEYSLSDAVDDAGTVTEAVQNGLNGDTDALWGQVAGLAVGITIESGCQFVAGFAGAPTAGVGAAAVEVGCAYASSAADDWTANYVENSLN